MPKRNKKRRNLLFHMENNRSFIVVQFLESPFEGIGNYVVVPDLWLIVRRPINQRVFVSYPGKEDSELTKDRVKRLEEYNDEWTFYKAEIKHVSDTYEDAEQWIAMRNNFELEVHGTQDSSRRNYRFKIKRRLRLNPYQNSQMPSISDQLYCQIDEKLEDLEKSVPLQLNQVDLASRLEKMAVTSHGSLTDPEDVALTCDK